MRIGLISDTHLPSLMRTLDELGPQVGDFLASVDLILHGGDVVGRAVVDWCEQYAPTVVARGNNDIFEDPRLAEVQRLDIEGWRIGMVHELRPESRPIHTLIDTALDGDPVDILIGGDTHVERLEYRDGVVLVNSGSPTLPHHKETRLGTAALLDVRRDWLHVEIVTLGETEGRPNPSTPQHMVLEVGRLLEASRGGQALTGEDLADLQRRAAV